MKIEIISSQYLVDLIAIENDCFGPDAWNEGMIQSEFDNPLSRFFGVFEDEKLVGYCCVRLIFDEAHINNVAILSNYRRRGYAKKLIEKMFEFAKVNKVTKFTLEVSVSNGAAIALYKQFGFVAVGVRPNYYHIGTDAIIMWRQ